MPVDTSGWGIVPVMFIPVPILPIIGTGTMPIATCGADMEVHGMGSILTVGIVPNVDCPGAKGLALIWFSVGGCGWLT